MVTVQMTQDHSPDEWSWAAGSVQGLASKYLIYFITEMCHTRAHTHTHTYTHSHTHAHTHTRAHTHTHKHRHTQAHSHTPRFMFYGIHNSRVR